MNLIVEPQANVREMAVTVLVLIFAANICWDYVALVVIVILKSIFLALTDFL